MKKTLIFIALALLTISVAAQDEPAGNELCSFRLPAAERKRTLQDMSEDEAEAFLKERHERRLAVLKEVISGRGSTRTDSTQYDCGEIPNQQGITPFGGRTYTVPIVCEADSRRVLSQVLYPVWQMAL